MKSIEQWKTEVCEFEKKINKKLNKNKEIKDLYYGFEVIDGKLIDNPELLFIGINPGAGDKEEDREKEVICNTNKNISYLDIYDDDYRDSYPNTYHLAEKTIKFFRLASWSDEKIKDFFTNKVVKTNFYHIATKNTNDLKTILKITGIKDEYYRKSADFVVNLIKLLKPKLIILEGKMVFDNLDFILGDSNYNKKDWKENKFTCVKDNNMKTTFLAYYRMRFTNENKEKFAKKLKELL